MHVFVWAEDSEAELRAELQAASPGAPATTIHDSLIQSDFVIAPGQRLPHFAFARQLLPQASAITAPSIRAWADMLAHAVIGVLPDDHPWSLHVEPHYAARTTHRIGARAWHSATRHVRPAAQHASSPKDIPDPEAGRHRCELIRQAFVETLQKRRRHLLRQLRPQPVPFTPADSIVQLVLTSPDHGYLSVAPAPMPFEQRHIISSFPKGEVAVPPDKAAPSRAFGKLVEAEMRFGHSIQAGQSCVDLGAAPGSWTYVAATRGARVTAVDRSPLRDDLMRDPRVRFEPGDAFSFKPPRPVDWLLCDVIAAPDRSAQLLLEWLQRGWCKSFVVTLKLKDASGLEALTTLKHELPPVTTEFFLTRLCANKKEVCAFGCAR